MDAVCSYPDCGGECLECDPPAFRRSIAEKMDRLRSDIETTNAEILDSARQAEFYSQITIKNVRKLDEYRRRLSALTQHSYKATE